MPEAVASNSIPVSEDQDKRKQRRTPSGYLRPISTAFEKLHPRIQKDVDQVDEMLKAHGQLVAAAMETGDDFSLYSDGIHLIYRLIISRLNEVMDSVGHRIDEMHGSRFLKEPSDMEVLVRVGQMVASAYADTGVDMDIENQAGWSNDVFKVYSSATRRYYTELIEQLDGDTHLLTIGSLLPWLELKIRREIVGDETDLLEPEDMSLRDTIIAEKAREGIPTAEISQALNIRKTAVERVIGRLMANHPEGISDATRARIERAADEPEEEAS